MIPNNSGCIEGGVPTGSGSVAIIGDVGGVGMHHGGGSNMHVSMQNGGAKGGACDGNADAHLKKGPWTAEEDAILVEYVRKHGEGNWNAVQRHSGLARCGKSCRLRWANHLRPNLKKGAFSSEEERLIVELHAKFGNKWARMASLLPGRTDNEIKNYWNTRVKRHQRQGLPLYPPDVQPLHPPSPHFHHHHPKSPSMSLTNCTTPTSSFTFQTHFAGQGNPHTPPSATPPPVSPTTTSTSFPTLPLFEFSQPHQHLNHHHHHHHHNHSTPTTPTSSFSFQTHIQSPNSHSHTTASTPPPLSPLSSPSTTPNAGFPTLPLFDFNFPRTPPILQAPLRFKRFSSNPDISTMDNNTLPPPSPSTISPNPQFSFLSPLPPSSTSPMSHQMPFCFGSFINNSNNNSDFHSELQKENQEMSTLLASVTQTELPSNQYSLSLNQNRNLGIGAATTTGSKFGRRITKKKFGNCLKDKMDGKLGFALEDLLQEAKTLTDGGQTLTNQKSLDLQDQKTKMLDSEGYVTHWDESNSIGISSGLDQKVEVEGQLNAMPEDLSRVLNNLPPMQPELYSDSADISHGQSSVVTDDNIGFEMQQIASMFPPAEHDRTLGSCSWDNLPGIC